MVYLKYLNPKKGVSFRIFANVCCLSQALVGWLRRFNMLYSSSDEQPIHSELARLSRIPLPEEDPRYWPLLHRLVAVGRVEEAIDLLGSHSIWTTSYQSQQQDPHLHAQVPHLTFKPHTLNLPCSFWFVAKSQASNVRDMAAVLGCKSYGSGPRFLITSIPT